MHFRERGPSVFLVRTTYNPENKRPKTEVVGRIPRFGLEVPDDLKAKLNPAETAEVALYVERTRMLDHLRHKVAAHGLLQTVAEAVEYANNATDEAERDQLRAIFAEAIIALRRASGGGAGAGAAGRPPAQATGVRAVA